MKIDLKKRAQRSQSTVEFALGLVVLITILSGLLDLGRAYFVYTQLEDAVGEGALYLAISPRCRTAVSGVGCGDPNNAEYRIKNSGGGLVDWSAISVGSIGSCTNCFSIIYQDTTDPAVGYTGADIYPNYEMRDTVIVTITYQFPLLTPIVPQIAGSATLPLTVRATQSIIEK